MARAMPIGGSQCAVETAPPDRTAGATGVQDEAVGVAEEGDEFTRFRFDEHGRAERDDGAEVEVADEDGGVVH
jgi:hypothetical protein